ncbi:serine-rich adhesin for platelets-like isoform X1 [Clytia hemisphaerica]|uniref:Uncharacterized protein n=1 Tax=Clytia hemisphaerica TaxID=252671 RepID=A0A7M5WT36_9CNID
MHSSRENQEKLLEVVLAGGPPWGFTLTGGSEFGSKLYVKKVTEENKAIEGELCVGDEILSVNGVQCTSRANAIQMVRNIDDQLHLNIARWKNVPSDLQSRSSSSASSSIYDSMAETMSDLSQSYYSLKRNSIQTKNFNNNESQNNMAATSKPKYTIKTYNSKGGGDHSTTTTITATTSPRERSVDTYNERSVDTQPQATHRITASQPHRQKVTVKMVPAASRTSTTVYPSNTSKVAHTQQRPASADPLKSTGSESGIDETDAVERESVQKVSKARAMFENLSSSKLPVEQSKPQRPKLKSWNSGGALLEETSTGEKKWNVTKRNVSPKPNNNSSNELQPPVHKHSRSLPIEIAGQDFAAAYAAYRQAAITATSTNDTERPKSAFVYTEPERDNVPAVPQRYSQSDMLKNYNRSRASHGHLDFPLDVNSRTSKSTEDLISSNDAKRASSTTPPAVKTGSANELRQAANKYHKELYKNYPKFRHSISGKEAAVPKYPRRLSEDSFSRGEPLRATIATTHVTNNSRTPRSLSADGPLAFNLGGENSMMSRLLQGQQNAAATLMKIDEEAKRNQQIQQQQQSNDTNNNSNNSPVLIRSNSVGGANMYYHRRQMEPEPSAQVLPHVEQEFETLHIEDRKERNTPSPSINTTGNSDTLDDNRTTPVKVTTSAHSSPQQHAITPTTSNNNSADNSFDTGFEPAQYADIDATNENILLASSRRTPDLDSQKPMAVTPELTHLQNYMHSKDSSTDSAVYVTPKDHVNHHVTAYSGESTGSLNDDFENHNSLQLDSNQHTEENNFNTLISHDEALHENEVEKEKEKPQRTINRKKKDSGPISRNSSCVSTDSTTSTATVDSGIVVRLDSSPRDSPISSSQYYSNKDLSTSRETLDDDVRALEESEKNNATAHCYGDDDSILPNDGLQEESLPSTPTSIDDLDNEKSKLIDSMREKINELRDQEQEIAEEIKMNEELGKKVLGMVESKATQSEFSKYELFIGELNKIVALLLSLTQRLHRYEMMLQDLDMTNESDKLKKDGLISKIDKLKSQHEEACYLRDVNDKRGDNVSNFLAKYCDEEEFSDFQYYVDMKSQLALMQSEIREKVKLGEERLKALEQTGSDWGIG